MQHRPVQGSNACTVWTAVQPSRFQREMIEPMLQRALTNTHLIGQDPACHRGRVLQRQDALHVLAELDELEKDDLDGAILVAVPALGEIVGRQHPHRAVQAVDVHRPVGAQADQAIPHQTRPPDPSPESSLRGSRAGIPVQTRALREADRLIDPVPGVFLIDHRGIVVAQEEKGLDVDDVVGFVVEDVEVLKK